MTLEVEQKFRVLLDAVASFREMGVVVRPVEETDLYFQHPARDFAASDEALRIRQKAGVCLLTYKGPKLDHQDPRNRPPSSESAAPSIAICSWPGLPTCSEVRKQRAGRAGRTPGRGIVDDAPRRRLCGTGTAAAPGTAILPANASARLPIASHSTATNDAISGTLLAADNAALRT
jgi:hypothetical protein